MSKHKYVSGSLRRRARTGRLVLNRRGRILNGKADATVLNDSHHEKAVKEVTIEAADATVSVMENDHNFSKLESGNFMIFKAGKTSTADQMAGTKKSKPAQPAMASAKNKAIFSQSLHIDRDDTLISERLDDQVQPAGKSLTKAGTEAGAGTAEPVTKNNKALIAATVVQLHAPDRKAKHDMPALRPYSDHPDTMLNTNSADTSPKMTSEIMPEQIAENQAPDPMPDAQILAQLEHDHADQDQHISTDMAQEDMHLLPDSEQDSDHDLTADDKMRIQNWEIGSKVGAAMETIVAEAIGDQVRQLTRNIIRDMLDEGILQLAKNTDADDNPTDEINNA
jgi:hypothetical protein